jgi:hypothetical protein
MSSLPDNQRRPGQGPSDQDTLPPRPRMGDAADATLPPRQGAAAAAGVAPTAAAAAPPALLNHPRYRILRLLGQGGMGAVYLAEHLVMGRQVALKTINAQLLAGADAVARFRREVMAVAKLTHPNVVTAYDADQAGPLHFLVMEYVEGHSLAEHVARNGRMTAVQACVAVCQAALGLQHAHERGLVHRDIKPQNLMLTPKGQVKVLDFGLAHFSHEDSRTDGAVTGTGVVLGTADYIAPEQTSSARSVDIRADVYSLGCTLYFLLTGSVPFPGGTTIDKMIQHATAPPPPLAALRPDLPAGLADAVGKMMAKRPEDRYPTPAEVFRALRPFAEPAPSQPAPRALPVPAAASPFEGLADARPAPSPGRGAPGRKVGLLGEGPWGLVVVVGGGVFAFLGVFLLWWLLSSGGPRKNAVAGAGDKPPPLPPPVKDKNKPPPPPPEPELSGGTAVMKDVPRSLDEVLGFREAHGASKEELGQWWARAEKDNYRMFYVGAQVGSRQPLFNAVAIKQREQPPFLYFPPAPVEKMVHVGGEAWNKGFRSLLYCAYQDGEKDGESTVWVHRGKDDVCHGFKVGNLEEVLAELGEQAMSWRPVSLSCTFTAGRRVFRMVTAPAGNRQYKAFSGLSAGQLSKTVAEYRDKGWRPDVVAAYPDGGVIQFFLVVVNNPEKCEWLCKVCLSATQHEALLAEQGRKGMFPFVVVSHGVDGDPRYTSLWGRCAPAAR